MKVCTNCGIEKPVKDFSPITSRYSGKKGLSSWCRSCTNSYSQHYRKAKQRERRSAREVRNGDCQECFTCKKLRGLSLFIPEKNEKGELIRYGRKCYTCRIDWKQVWRDGFPSVQIPFIKSNKKNPNPLSEEELKKLRRMVGVKISD